MTEAEWLACSDPRLLMRFLRKSYGNADWLRSGRAERHLDTPRRWRLVAVGCCWRLPRPNRQDITIIETVERWADLDPNGLLPDSEMARFSQLRCESRYYATYYKLDYPRLAAWLIGSVRSAVSHRKAVQNGKRSSATLKSHVETEKLYQTAIIKDIFPNPFRPIVADPAWLTPTVHALASAIYADRAFDRLPILADALEEAGCTNADLLLHCRQPGEHVRGCWAIDLVLGKV